MAEAPKTVPPGVIEALKRGDKAAALKLLMPGGKISNLKDVMQLLQSLQESGVVKNLKVNVDTNRNRPAPLPARPPHGPAHGATPSVSAHPGLAPGEVPRTGSAGALAFVAVLVAAALAAWFFLK
jgi:hypothetical protein